MKRYSLHLISAICGILLCLCLFNWFINPYDMFESPDIDGFNSYKSEVGRHTRLSRVYQVDRMQPEVILLASSRGLVVPDAALSDNELHGINLSLTSATTYELLRMMQHANNARRLKKVILALDESFTGIKQPGFIENRLAVHYDGKQNKDAWKQSLKDMFQGLLSFDALRASIRTIGKQKEDPASAESEYYRALRIRSAGGHRQMFRNLESSLFLEYKGNENQCTLVANSDEIPVPESFIYFRKIVEIAYQDNIDLYIYFSPIHARLYEAECMVGMRASYNSMKRQVVATVENIAEQYDDEPFPVWDFSGYSTVTTEQVPEAGNTDDIMKWYWEGSHYTKQAAEKIFDRMFSREGYLADFGMRITTDNISEHLIIISKKRQDYLGSHQDDIVELQQQFKMTRPVH